MRRALIILTIAALSACGGGDDEPVRSTPPSPTELCPALLRRLEAADDEVRRLTEKTENPDPALPPAASQELLDKLDKATREYLKIRVRAAAQGCVAT